MEVQKWKMKLKGRIRKGERGERKGSKRQTSREASTGIRGMKASIKRGQREKKTTRNKVNKEE